MQVSGCCSSVGGCDGQEQQQRSPSPLCDDAPEAAPKPDPSTLLPHHMERSDLARPVCFIPLCPPEPACKHHVHASRPGQACLPSCMLHEQHAAALAGKQAGDVI